MQLSAPSSENIETYTCRNGQSKRYASLHFHSCAFKSWNVCALQAAKLGDLPALATVLRMVPRDLDEASGRVISTCNYATLLAEAFG